MGTLLNTTCVEGLLNENMVFASLCQYILLTNKRKDSEGHNIAECMYTVYLFIYTAKYKLQMVNGLYQCQS